MKKQALDDAKKHSPVRHDNLSQEDRKLFFRFIFIVLIAAVLIAVISN